MCFGEFEVGVCDVQVVVLYCVQVFCVQQVDVGGCSVEGCVEVCLFVGGFVFFLQIVFDCEFILGFVGVEDLGECQCVVE